MQIFLDKPEKQQNVNQYISCTFAKNVFSVSFLGNICYISDAHIGEVFYVQPNGRKKPPTVTQAILPQNRGDKIAWALAFCTKNARATSYSDFENRFENMVREEQTAHFGFMSEGIYGFLFAKRMANSKKQEMKPLLAWISNDITQEELLEMIDNYSVFRKIYCPITFLEIL